MKPNKFAFFPIISIIISNLIPLLFVLQGKAEVFIIVLLYWMESVVIGIFNMLKMILAQGTSVKIFDKLGAVSFFFIHYFGFMLGQLIFIIAFIGSFSKASIFIDVNFKILFLVLFLSQALIFINDYIISGEYKNTDLRIQMFKPYSRVIIQQVVIVLGGYLLIYYKLGNALVFLALLVTLKIAADIAGYILSTK